jgi:hypothetical protein
MTAEIAIMNKSGIALAADSAVSIETAAGTKVYYTNKLFMLSKYHPVGVMVYGNADLMGVPWESIIKTYRQDLRDKSFKLLEDYGTDFLAYLDKNAFLFPADEQQNNIYRIVFGYFDDIADMILDSVEKESHKGLRVTKRKIEQIVSSTIRRVLEFFVSLPRVPSLPKDFERQFIRKYSYILQPTIDEAFLKLPLSRANRKQLQRIAVGLFVKDTSRFIETSGVVVAGFGESELYPSLVSYQVECVVNDRLKYIEYNKAKIDHHTTASVLPFAQREMVVSFMEGISPDYQDSIKAFIATFLDKYPEELIKRFTHLRPAERKLVLQEMKKDGASVASQLWQNLNEWAAENSINPIVTAGAILPTEELASMAESLVNLTSFKRRVTLDAETVSGPIDVALISKGDGFIWMKRKHYFDGEKNPHFLRNYYR